MAFYQKLLELFQSIHNSERFLDVFPELEAQILELLQRSASLFISAVITVRIFTRVLKPVQN